MSIADVTARIAMLESRLASLDARVGRGGGVVGAAVGATMDAALAKAEAGTAPSTTAPAASTEAAASTAVPATEAAAGAWSANLPAAGRRWAGAIETAAEEHGVEPALLGALVWTESAFDPDAVSPAGAIGLGQLMPGTAAGLGVDPTDPAQNLDGAARYLREQLDRFGETRLALAAYNAGPGRVASAGGVPRIEETMNYVERVTSRAATLGAPA